MANTLKFNPEHVIEQAKILFWRKGFNGTTSRDLQSATGLKPGSLYSTFGNKEQLYKFVLDDYVADNIIGINKALESSPSIIIGLMSYLKATISVDNIHNQHELCLLVKTISELDESHADLVCTAKEMLMKMELSFSNILEQAILNGELHSKLDASALAKSLQVLIIGLRHYARATGNVEFVHSEIDDFFKKLSH